MTSFTEELSSLLNKYSIDTDWTISDNILSTIIIEYLDKFKELKKRIPDDIRVNNILAILKSVNMNQIRIVRMIINIEGDEVVYATLYYNFQKNCLIISKDSKSVKSDLIDCAYSNHTFIPGSNMVENLDKQFPGFDWRLLPIQFE